MSESRPTVLIVDDSPEDRAVYRHYLADVYEIQEAERGTQALALCQSLQPACLLLDYRLPDGDGVEWLACIRAQYDALAPPVILLTGAGNEALAVEAMKQGAQDYLVKGQLTPEALRRAVRHAMEAATLHRALAAHRQQVQESEARYRTLLEALADGVFVAQDSRFVFVNAALPAMLGYDAAEFVGLPFAAVVAPEFLALWAERFIQRLGEGPEPPQHDDVCFLRKGGEERCWVELRASRIPFNSSAAVLGIVRDVTMRKRAEEALQQAHATLEQRVQERTALLEVMQDITRAANEATSSAEALQYAVDRLCAYMGWPVGHVYLAETAGVVRWAPTAIWHLDTPERFTVFQQATQAVEFAAGESMIGRVGALGQPDWRVDVTTDPAFRRQRAALEAGLKAGFAVPILVGPEVVGVLEFYATAPLAPDAALLDAVTQIGTQLGRAVERERAAELAQRQQEALLQREKLVAMGSLLASVAHELNNPLAAILLQANLLRDDAGSGPLAAYATEITQAATRCERLVHQFLTLAHPHTPERTAVDLHALIAATLELLAPALRVDTIAVDLCLAAELPPLWADPHQLQQVLVNLLTNAQQALRDVTTPRQVTLTTRYDAARTRITLDITDTGPGIPPDIQARIFEPFFTTKAPGVGTGLGLSLCQGIIAGHGGTISVISPPGQGTTFRVKLPVGVAPETAPSPPGRDDTTPPVPRATILLVDDEPILARGLARLLHRDGHTVESVANGRLALAALQERAYDLILSDMRMPELDGPGLYQVLAQQSPHLCQRMIFLTGDTLSPEALAFFAQSGVPRLTKPFTAAAVRDAIGRSLRAGMQDGAKPHPPYATDRKP